MAGAFLVCMGAVTICPPTRLPTVTPRGFKELFGLDGLNGIDRKQAGNKTDAIGKTLVCVQGIWMIVQCKATGLPVTI